MPQYKPHRRGPKLPAGSSSAYAPPSEETTPLLPGTTRRTISRDRRKLITYGLPALLVALFFVVTLSMHFVNCPLYPWTMNAIRRQWEKEEVQQNLLREEWRLEKQEHEAMEEKWKLQTEWHDKDVARRIREEGERQARARQEWAQEFERHVHEVEEYEKTVARRVHEEQERQERVREEWDHEARDHKKEIARRVYEEQERQERVRKEWGGEAQEHKKEIANRTQEEEERQERIRERWDHEVQEHEMEVVRRMQKEEERQERIREEWAQEVERHTHECEEMKRRENQRRENERKKWRREVEDHDRIEEERRKREEEERQKLNMFWGGIEAHTCTTYATKEYTAQLMNLPTTWEHRVDACKATPLEVHGVSYLPKSCEDMGPGAVIGRWGVNLHEPDCATFWNWYKDKGCTSPGSGKRRIEHYLENLPEGSDWREFCATTPARFHGMEFSGAQECFQINLGTYGHWEIDDADCQ